MPHVTDIKNPLERRAWWKAWEDKHREILSDCRSCPSEYGHLMEEAEREIDYALAAIARIDATLEADRRLEQAIEEHEFHSTATRYLEQAR